MKVVSNLLKSLSNKRVIQFTAVLALLNIVGFVMVGKVKAVIAYVVFAVLTRYFSNNMALVLGLPLILINLLSMRGNMLEGMENGTSTSTSGDSSKDDANAKKPDANAKKPDANANKPDAKTSQGLKMNPVEQDNSNREDNAAQTTGGEQQGFEAGRRKNRGYEIDYATTVEDAYDQLNEILGGDGIKRLTEDTQGLMKQQMQLAEAMKGMGPVIEQLKPMMESLKGMMGNGKEGGGLGGIMDLAKQIAGPKRNQ